MSINDGDDGVYPRNNGEGASGLIRSLLSFMFIPLSFVQEVFEFLKEKAGLKRRTLEGKVVIITGASSGIGESLAQLFYFAGCRLILVSRRRTELERVKNELVRSKTVGNVHVPAIVEMDISDFESIGGKSKSMVDIWGYVDILINNAGMSYRGEILNTELHVHQQLMNVNYFGTIELTKHIAASMVDRKSGQVVFVNSVQGKLGVPYRSAYSASKHALIAYADTLRAEISKHGVSVTSICPGYVQTNISLNAITGSGDQHGVMDQNTSEGYPCDLVSRRILRAILNEEKEVVIAQSLHKFAILIRYLVPALFFYLMTKRAKNIQKS